LFEQKNLAWLCALHIQTSRIIGKTMVWAVSRSLSKTYVDYGIWFLLISNENGYM